MRPVRHDPPRAQPEEGAAVPTTQTNSNCDCARCQNGCAKNPGWFTPDEAAAAIAAGFASRLMRDWLEPCADVGNDDRIYVLAPASAGREGRDAPECRDWIAAAMGAWSKGRCTFFKAGLCEIHESGFKPIQCRTAFMCSRPSPDYPDNYTMARMWDTDAGRAALEAFAAAVERRP